LAAEAAGAIEPFRDAALYDWEYRRRRDDVAFYRMLADERGGPILDLGCGTGRLLIPLLRDGHRVIGVDLSRAMLARAAARRRRLAPAAAARGTLLEADFRALPVRGHFPLVIAAFHGIQHLIADRDLTSVLRAIRRLLGTDGWFAFDVFSPRADWLARAGGRRFDRTLFRHPATGQKLAYSVSHRLDRARRALHMRFHYQPVSDRGGSLGRGRTVRLCHRQLAPDEVAALLRRAGLRILACWGGFRGEPLEPHDHTEQHVYLAGPAPGAEAKIGRSPPRPIPSK
jgi:SAM-dependent methyltransferase